MSSIWDSRFQTTERRDVSGQSQSHSNNANIDIGNVLAAAYKSLPQVDSNMLTTDKFLGSGSVFHVNREIYGKKDGPTSKAIVAVKYMRVERGSERQRQILSALLRELRVHTSAFLRSHPHILSAFGYGWSRLDLGDVRPFLMVPYADYGTLSEFLQAYQLQRDVSILERHDLALDVASGLQALHECGIIHGDVKSNNILVCQRSEPLGYTFGANRIPWVAKIGDFGSSFTSKEADECIVKYTGTAVYNAPEIEGYGSECSNAVPFEAYKKSDVYSFGLLLWEVMKMGRFYLETFYDEALLLRKKRYREYLQNKHNEPGDALLEIAVQSCQSIEFDTAESEVYDSVIHALTCCLRKHASQRVHMAKVVAMLGKSVRGDRPPVVHSLSRPTSVAREMPISREAYLEITERIPRSKYGFTRTLMDPTWAGKLNASGQTLRMIPLGVDIPRRTEHRLVVFTHLDTRNLKAPDGESDAFISLQRGIMSPRPPQSVQRCLVNRWEAQIRGNHDTTLASKACMELSVCYHMGFVVEQDQHRSVELLRQACYGNHVAKSILGRVSALSKEECPIRTPLNAKHDFRKDVVYFSNRIRSMRFTMIKDPDLTVIPHLSLRPSHRPSLARMQLVLQLFDKESQCSNGATEEIDISRLDQMWEDHGREHSVALESLSQVDISAALTEACRLGLVNVAKDLASMCSQYIGNFEEPSPLHWLIMFPPEQARIMANLLVLGPENCVGHSRGICFRRLNARISYSIFLPEHCMELAGTPLHWAVRSRNLELVKAFLDLGADMTVRLETRGQVLGAPPSPIMLNYSPLDIALQYHLYEIVDLLLDRSRKCNPSKILDIGASLLGHTATPFSRYVIHGHFYRLALQKTIEVLVRAEYDLEGPDYFGGIPLLVSLQNDGQEQYIVSELLKVTPGIAERPLPDGQTLTTFVVLSAGTDRPSMGWKLQMLLPLIQDINAQDDDGHSALHYCALVDNAPMAKVLLSKDGIDINGRGSNRYGSTALIHAAVFGRTEVLKLLIEAGADLELTSREGLSALECAVLSRQLGTASMLIEHGAEIDFRVHNSVPESTVLHAACKQPTKLPPIVKSLLARHMKLRSRTVLNRIHRSGFTPLTNAAHFADLESVEALLYYGADPWAPHPQHFWYCQPLEVVNALLRKSAENRLDRPQLMIASQGQGEHDLMRRIPFLSEHDRRSERFILDGLEEGTKQFDSRLEDIQIEKQGQAGLRNFLARLEEIKRQLEDKAKQKGTHIA